MITTTPPKTMRATFKIEDSQHLDIANKLKPFIDAGYKLKRLFADMATKKMKCEFLSTK